MEMIKQIIDKTHPTIDKIERAVSHQEQSGGTA